MTTLFESNEKKAVVMMEFAEVTDTPSSEELAREQEATAAAAAEAAAREAVTWQARLLEERKAGREEMRLEYEEKLRDAIEVERTAVTMACAGFAKSRERYFDEIESETVKLSLAIAARVLQRDVTMDPTLLAGVVRVALSKLSDTDGVVLTVPTADLDVWRRAMKSSCIRVQGDNALKAGDVQLRTVGGVAELGVEAQLVEIERGFFDLLAKRPA